ncbi:MAG: RimK family alpha-L-glutamate ligase [Eubacterium sp.]|nr:RimK family alpha-L-glutamate ligase [Eubacterium sp.]
MRAWLIRNGFLKSQKFDHLNTLFLEAARKLDIDLQLIDNNQILAGQGLKDCDLPDFVLFWDKDILLARELENAGIPLFNSGDFIEICDDKRLCHQALYRAGIPLPKAYIAPMTYDQSFSNLDFLDQVEELGFPLVVKEAFGSFGQQVYLAKDRRELEELVAGLSTTQLIFQEFIETSQGRDLRLQVVGDQVVASMYRYSQKDFRANVSAGGKMKPHQATREQKDLAVRAVKALGGDFAGVDLLFGPQGKMLVCEVNSNAHFKNLLDCTGVHTEEKILAYIKEKLSHE